LGGKIGRLTPAGVLTEFAIPTPESIPVGIAAGPDGNLWFTESGTNQVGRISPAGAITQFAVPKTALAPSVPSSVTGLPPSFLPVYDAILSPGNTAPAVIKAGPDGNLWFTEAIGNVVARITPAGAITQFLVPTPNSAPGGLTTGLDGNLWFTEGLGNQIGRLNLNNTGLTISPASPLPTITDPVIIDGYTQPGASSNTLAIGSNAVLLIELNGANAGSDANGLTINAGSSTVRGLAINRFGGVGIQVASSQNLIDGNFLGTDPTGTVGRGNTLDGIRLNGASNNRIIGNVVSDNGINQDAAGINLEASALNNIIAGNKIGTDVSGNKPLGNSLHGVFLGNGSSNNTIDGNVISGNGKFPVTEQTSSSDLSTAGGVGVYIFGANTSGNAVLNNDIGTNFGGSAALPNSVIGVLISLSSGNTVQGNLISGNGLVGLEIAGGTGGTASRNLVQGNKIGTNLDGTAAIANGRDGIFINDASNNTIGGTTAGAGNQISGNGSVGIQLFGPLTQGNVIESNALGLDSAGRPTLPNRAGGIFVNTGPLTNQVGGTAPGQANQGQTRQQFTLTGFHQSHTGPRTRHSPPAGRRFRVRGSLRTSALR
jgi:parallel beta-helix repeat protein